jgi:hypothetical protein
MVDLLFNLFCMFLASMPAVGLVIITFILIHYNLRRARWRRRRRQGKRSIGFCPSSAALGMALQFMQTYHRPSMAHVLEARQEAREEADEDDHGDPETPAVRRRHFLRQLRRISRGEPMERLVLRI